MTTAACRERNAMRDAPGDAVARWCAEVHGGRIAVQSHPGQSSIFTVTLPLAVPDEDTASPASPDDTMAAPTHSST